MNPQVSNAVIAMLCGGVVAVLAFVPTAAYQYRLDGRLGARDLAVLATAPIYLLSLWTYTLLPFPRPGSLHCKSARLDPLTSLAGIRTHDTGGLLGLLHDPTFMQLALNVLLFVPLGWFLRVVLRSGWITATALGFSVSLIIESTQLTGVWNLYQCAYRTFDVDDLVTNTLGALLGSLLSYVVLDRRDETTPPLPSTISIGRRLTGFISDALFSLLAGGAAAALYRGTTLYGPGTVDRTVLTVLVVGVPVTIQVLSVLIAGRTIGEHVVAVRAIARGGRLRARVVKLFAGLIPAYLLVLASPADWRVGAVGLPVLFVVHVVAAIATRSQDCRGLSHLLARMDLRIATDEVFGPPHPQATHT